MSVVGDVLARRRYFVLAAAVLVVDQATKIVADASLRGKGAVPIIPGFFNLTYSRNRGGLFGYLSSVDDPWRLLLLTVLPLLAIVLIALFLARTPEHDRVTLNGLGLVLGGAVGNLLDRAIRGEVVDFLDVYVSRDVFPDLASWLTGKLGSAHWPTFNAADSAIVMGAILLFVEVVRPSRHRRAEEAPAE